MSRPRALVVTHGEVGAALVRAVEGFLGPQVGLDAISNVSHSTADLRILLERDADERSGHLLVFTDMKGGSCDTAARLAVRGRATASVSGVNLPMLVEFCHYRDRLTFTELVARVARKGAVSIEVTRGDET